MRLIAGTALMCLRQGALAFFFSCLVSLYLFAVLPPTWNGGDSEVQLNSDIHVTIPHFPPGYVLPIRYLSYLTSGRMASTMDCLPLVSTRLVYAIIGAQHLLLAFAIATFVGAIAETWWHGVLAVAVLALGPFHLYNHGIFTEGPTISLLLIVLAAAYRYYAGKGLSTKWLWLYYGALFGLILLRHSNIVFAVLLPALCLLAVVRSGQRRERVWRLGKHTLGMVATILLAQATFLMCCICYDVTYRSIMGRAVTHKIYTDLELADAETKECLIHRLQAATDNTVVKEAIPLVIHGKQPWFGTLQALQRLIVEQHGPLPSQATIVLADKLLNKVAWLYLLNFDRCALKGTGETFLSYFSMNDVSTAFIIKTSMESVAANSKNDQLAALRFFRDKNQPCERFQAFQHSLYYAFVSVCSERWLLVLVACLWLAHIAKSSMTGQRVDGFVPVVIGLGLLHLLVASAITCFVCRYMVPTTVTLLAGLAILSGLIGWRGKQLFDDRKMPVICGR
jgi:hypothetical protein